MQSRDPAPNKQEVIMESKFTRIDYKETEQELLELTLFLSTEFCPLLSARPVDIERCKAAIVKAESK